MQTIVFITDNNNSTLTEDDQLAARAIYEQSQGAYSVIPWDWQKGLPKTDTPLAAVVIRSAWNYTQHFDAFFEFVAALEREPYPTFNAPELLKWNSNKTYLRELEREGISIVPTQWLKPDAVSAALEATATKSTTSGSNSVWILKSSRSANADRTQRITRSSVDLSLYAPDELLMLQPFLSEISGPKPTDGEWSLLYFNGTLSHCALKRPAPSDFRVQWEFGGSVSPPSPHVPIPEALLNQADRAVEILARRFGRPLYARVDQVLSADGPKLMELECLEPALYFSVGGPESAHRFATALIERITLLTPLTPLTPLRP